MHQQPIQTVAAVIANAEGDVLLVRKRSSAIFIQPGGKTEPGEAALTTLARELNEELGVCLDPASADYLGEFEAVAVNEPGSYPSGICGASKSFDPGISALTRRTTRRTLWPRDTR